MDNDSRNMQIARYLQRIVSPEIGDSQQAVLLAVGGAGGDLGSNDTAESCGTNKNSNCNVNCGQNCGSCKNSTKGCKGATNGGDCVNYNNQCDGASNGGNCQNLYELVNPNSVWLGC